MLLFFRTDVCIRKITTKLGLLVSMITAVFIINTVMTFLGRESAAAATDNLVTATTCSNGSLATIYAEGLSRPDGLTFGLDDFLYVVEETADRSSRIDSVGVVSPILVGLANPEGIFFDGWGNLYIVEDAADGRLIR